ncbi:YhgE/Pip domain-containing protein [Actinomadura harenae]|uniref:YhgE/Pip domain-containing protein n=1 Tax=Actinomadura harenae TaxID=2483351 RepID=A0A3M2LUA8_9ACTN|nr:YhgE/Pip domain-containing protein [Actinomadura harenae]RMI40123.1 YhgE/Pip domain-containing protein [Actinomadura harenae]
MRALRLAPFELLRFRTALQRLALAFVVIVPTIYGGIYLWSNWNPYNRLSRVPVAVVNEDRAVQAEGRTIDAGADFVSELRRDRLLGWHFVGARNAAHGLAHGRYYAVITVPPDFSSRLTSGATGMPEKAAMSIRLDDANNYLVGVMAKTVQSELERKISAAAISAYFEAAFGRLSQLHSGISDAADGAAQLGSGLTSAKDGSAQLVSGLGAAKQGSAALASGLGQASTGTAQLANGLAQLKAGSSKLAPGAEQVAGGVHDLAATAVPLAELAAAGLAPLADRATAVTAEAARLTSTASVLGQRLAKDTRAISEWLRSLASRDRRIARSRQFRGLLASFKAVDGTAEQRLRRLASRFPALARSYGYWTALDIARGLDATLPGRLHRLAARYRISANDPVLRKLLGEADLLSERTADLARSTAHVNAVAVGLASDARGLQQVVPALRSKLLEGASGLRTLDQGAAAVATGARQLDNGVTPLLAGARQLRSGSGALLSGARRLDDGNGRLLSGAQQLDAGNAQLKEGAAKLASGLASARDQIPVIQNGDLHRAAENFANPVDVGTSNAHPARVYGRGLAPFFIAIGLWVFGIVAFLLLRPVSGRLLVSRLGAGTVAFAAFLPVLAVGLVAALVLFLILDVGLGLDPVSTAGTLGLMALGVATFGAIVQVLRVALGAVADAVALVLLITQLVSCGGLYPVETLPQPFRALHEVIPMTYLVEPLRTTISGGLASRALRDAGVLALYLAAALALLAGVVALRRRWRMSQLKPELDL